MEAHTVIINLKISAPTWNDEFELPGGFYSIWDIQDYFEYISKKHGEDIDKPSIQIYVNKIENRVTFKIKNGYSLELLTPDTMKLLGSTKNKINKDKNGKNGPHFETTEVVLVHCNNVNNDYQQDSRALKPVSTMTLCSKILWYYTAQKWSFPLRISSINVTKFEGNYRSGHIYRRNP